MRSARPIDERQAIAIGVVGLAGMAYCHVLDVAAKFDEHVYYMGTLFLCNISASLLLIPAVLLSRRWTARRAALVWAATGGLAALTIGGFFWSRTIGFPQMEDHVGQWDALGLASLAFELPVVAVSLLCLARARVVEAVA